MSRGVVGGVVLTFGDLSRTMRAIEEHHHVKVMLQSETAMSPMGGLLWTLSASALVRLGSGEDPFNPRTWAVTFREDVPDLGRTASSLYGSLIHLDVLLSKERWAQTPLPEG